MAKSKKRKNSDYKTSILTEETGTSKKEKKDSTRWAKAQEKAKERQRKKNQPAAKKEKGGVRAYFKGVKLEMKKVVWPTRSELGSFTVVVLATCAAFALLFWGIDSGVLAAIRAICF
ncbi:MAG: preprotein translocase subunit SecE [Lentihominibacter sp.]